MVEADPDGVSFENQSAFDVADMVKQYFRDLPEPIFSSKLCESFLHIYQCKPSLSPNKWKDLTQRPTVFTQRVTSCQNWWLKHKLRHLFQIFFSAFNALAFSSDFPKDQQFVGVQAAIYLLPDENREALQSLLLFLREVVACVEENQMTPTNIAVCLAPSLFHLNSFKRDRTSMRWV